MLDNVEVQAISKRVYRFGEFRVDGRIVDHQGSLIALSPKAVDLLYLLVSRAPEVVTKDEIFEAVWPGTYVVESSLARNISVIRKALEEKAEGPFIETIPKRGYRFVATVSEEAEAVVEAEPVAMPEVRVEAPARRRWTGWVVGLSLVIVLGIAVALWPRPEQVSEAEREGYYLLAQGTPAAAQRALVQFERAVKERPNSASAQAGLAECLLGLGQLGIRMPNGTARALAAAENAVRLDPQLAGAHAAMGSVRLLVDWDLPSAERSFRKALELDPGNRPAVHFFTLLLGATGRTGEALQVTERAEQAQKPSPLLASLRGRLHYYRGEHAQAIQHFERALAQDPHYALAHYYLGLTYAAQAKYVEAEQQLRAAELQPFLLRNDLAWLDLLRGNRSPLEEIYSDLKRQVEEGRLELSTLLVPAVELGRNDDAIAALNAAWRERNVDLLNLTVDPRLAGLRQDPRYGLLAREIGFVK